MSEAGKTPERVAEAARLRHDEGLGWRRIGERLGISTSTAFRWVNDPDGTHQQAFRADRRQPCVDCGAPTSIADGYREEPRCVPCANVLAAGKRRVWTRDALILAIQEWVREYGEPPGVVDWNPTQARNVCHDEQRAERFEAAHAAGRCPWFTTVVRVFGTWNAGIVAAGCVPRSAGGGDGNITRRRSARAA